MRVNFVSFVLKVYKISGVLSQLFSIRKLLWLVERGVCRFFSCFSSGTRGECAICCCCCCWAYPTVLTANWFTRVCFYAFPLQIETQTQTHTHTNTHTDGARGKADNENEARKQWWRWTTGPEAQQTQRGDRSHTDTEQCKCGWWLNPRLIPF